MNTKPENTLTRPIMEDNKYCELTHIEKLDTQKSLGEYIVKEVITIYNNDRLLSVYEELIAPHLNIDLDYSMRTIRYIIKHLPNLIGEHCKIVVVLVNETYDTKLVMIAKGADSDTHTLLEFLLLEEV